MYKIIFHKEVSKDLKNISVSQIKAIKTAIDERLSVRPYDFRALSGKRYKGLYRLRVGDFRIIYRIIDDENSVVILAIGHRREIYANFARK